MLAMLIAVEQVRTLASSGKSDQKIGVCQNIQNRFFGGGVGYQPCDVT